MSSTTMILNMIALTALLVETSSIGANARECLTNETVPLYGAAHSLTLTSPNQLIPLDGCETLIGDIEIHRHFHGSLILNSVTNFTGRILVDSNANNDGLEAIEMLNLLSITDIRLYRAWGLRAIQMPRLVSIAWQLVFTQGPEDSWMDFSALKTVNIIDIAGTWANVSFPALERVGSYFRIFTDPSREIVADRTDSVNIDLPALTKVRDLIIVGHVRSLSTPKLEALGEPEYIAYPKEVNQGGLLVSANYTNLSGVFLPSLRQLHGRFALDGHMSIIDLYGIKYTDATITVNASSPVEIYSALEQAGQIYITGDIPVINFTNLARAEKLEIVSDSEVHCSMSLIHAYRNINYPDEPSFCDAVSLDLAGETVYTHASSATPSLTPTPSFNPTHNTPTPGGGKLSAGLQACIAVVAIVAGGLLIGGFIMKCCKKKHIKREDATNVTTGGLTAGTAAVYNADATGGLSEVLPRHSADEAPPPYSRPPPGK